MSRNQEDYGINRDRWTIGVTYSLRYDFDKIQHPNYFALISREVLYADSYLERIIEEGKNKGGRDGWKVDSFWVKKMDDRERKQFPPTRFRNAITVAKRPSVIRFPNPVGMLYEGTGVDALVGENHAYFIASYVSGKPLITCFEELDEERRMFFFNILCFTLNDYRKKGIFPLDFAPRDIIYEKIDVPGRDVWDCYTLVDTEYVAIISDLSNLSNSKAVQILRREQKEEFRREYGEFLSKAEMREALKIVFQEM